jgi:hypothetical protein
MLSPPLPDIPPSSATAASRAIIAHPADSKSASPVEISYETVANRKRDDPAATMASYLPIEEIPRCVSSDADDEEDESERHDTCMKVDIRTMALE